MDPVVDPVVRVGEDGGRGRVGQHCSQLPLLNNLYNITWVGDDVVPHVKKHLIRTRVCRLVHRSVGARETPCFNVSCSFGFGAHEGIWRSGTLISVGNHFADAEDLFVFGLPVSGTPWLSWGAESVVVRWVSGNVSVRHFNKNYSFNLAQRKLMTFPRAWIFSWWQDAMLLHVWR